VLIVIGVVEFFWIATAPRRCLGRDMVRDIRHHVSPAADQAYASAKGRLLGIVLAAVLAAIVKFASAPG
jgi:hypothetical protein